MDIILVGGGKLIYHLAKKLISKGHFLTIINKDRKLAEDLSREINATVVFGDATNKSVLEDAGAYKADNLVALTQKDHNNLFICKMAMDYFGVERATALVNNPENEELFSTLGITGIFNITDLVSSIIEQSVASDDVSNLTMIEEGKLSIFQVEVSPDSEACGKEIKEIDLPLTIVLGGIVRNGDITIPRGGSKVQAGDKIVIISLPEEQAEAIKVFGGEE
ncbi:TrkA family potassium uptake protein [Halanaerobium sp.]|uniref:potassium channel family protein n=1 Tax=Halanaerobium sp. TaxID=1895664 RepID=UPI000DE6BBD6|nr:TrkA family potassium uptake protein [Halanaerobium sp.]PUU88810.1 MAG: trk system potassium uptake protein TrkA [Halanaerobium sp.]PUU91308.1 MAG: trk system potassium uptake protein TrkA [Halanaerobium sp.]